MSGYKRMRVISVVWGVLLILLVVGLTIIGFVYKHETTVYKEYEDLLVKQATSYVEDHSMYPEESLKITDEELLDDGYIETTYVNGHDCTGYVMVLKTGETFPDRSGKNSPSPARYTPHCLPATQLHWDSCQIPGQSLH